MAAIADRFHRELIVQERAFTGSDLGIVVTAGQHGNRIVDVGNVGKARVQRPHHVVVRGVGMAHGHQHAFGRKPPRHIQHAVHLRRSGYAPKRARFKHGHVVFRLRAEKKSGILRARALGVKVVAFQVRAQNARAVAALIHRAGDGL